MTEQTTVATKSEPAIDRVDAPPTSAYHAEFSESSRRGKLTKNVQIRPFMSDSK